MSYIWNKYGAELLPCTTPCLLIRNLLAVSRDTAIHQALHVLHTSVPGSVMQLVLVQSRVLRSGTTVEPPLPRPDGSSGDGVTLSLNSTQGHQVMQLYPLPLQLRPGGRHNTNSPTHPAETQQ